jgi:hypothetical protein
MMKVLFLLTGEEKHFTPGINLPHNKAYNKNKNDSVEEKTGHGRTTCFDIKSTFRSKGRSNRIHSGTGNDSKDETENNSRNPLLCVGHGRRRSGG